MAYTRCVLSPKSCKWPPRKWPQDFKKAKNNKVYYFVVAPAEYGWFVSCLLLHLLFSWSDFAFGGCRAQFLLNTEQHLLEFSSWFKKNCMKSSLLLRRTLRSHQFLCRVNCSLSNHYSKTFRFDHLTRSFLSGLLHRKLVYFWCVSSRSGVRCK